MSQSALCQAVANHLRTVFSLDSNSVEVGFDGSPKPGAGQFYLAVHPLQIGGISCDWDLSEEYSVAVTPSIRLGATPKDRRGIAIWLDQPISNPLNQQGLHQIVRACITAIHKNELLRSAANTIIQGIEGALGGGGIVTDLQFLSVQPPQLRSYDWFNAAPAKDMKGTDSAGVSQTITFGKAQRVQDVADME